MVASLDSTIFMQAAKGLPAKEIAGFEGLGAGGAMAEAPLNPAQDLMIAEPGLQLLVL